MTADMSRGPWISTWSGGKWYLSTPRPEDVNPMDIAYALSQLVRWNGHCDGITVAEHSCRVADRLLKQGHNVFCQLAGLLHDAHEAYLGDMVNPMKSLLPGIFKMQHESQRAINDAFGVMWCCDASQSELPAPVAYQLTDSPIVHLADNQELARESSCNLSRAQVASAREWIEFLPNPGVCELEPAWPRKAAFEGFLTRLGLLVTQCNEELAKVGHTQVTEAALFRTEAEAVSAQSAQTSELQPGQDPPDDPAAS